MSTIFWRDLAIGETLKPGDRIMQPGFQWVEWSSAERLVDKNTYPCQRRMDSAADTKEPGSSVPWPEEIEVRIEKIRQEWIEERATEAPHESPEELAEAWRRSSAGQMVAILRKIQSNLLHPASS